jgi:hypothetical protein
LCLAAVAAASVYAAAPIILQPGESVIVTALPGGGGVTPPSCTPPAVLNPATGQCETPPPPNNDTNCGVPGPVRHMVMSWQTPTRLYTSNAGGFAKNGAVVVAFTTGSVSSTTSLPRIAAAEYQSPPSSRIATLSSKPCDFGPQPTPGAAGEGNSVTMVFALGTGSGYGYYPVLQLNTTYFLNMKNSPATCSSTW